MSEGKSCNIPAAYSLFLSCGHLHKPKISWQSKITVKSAIGCSEFQATQWYHHTGMNAFYRNPPSEHIVQSVVEIAIKAQKWGFCSRMRCWFRSIELKRSCTEWTDSYVAGTSTATEVSLHTSPEAKRQKTPRYARGQTQNVSFPPRRNRKYQTSRE